jgi:hypothetical protein
VESQVVLDHLQIPMAARRASLFRRLTALMRAHQWEPIRIKLNGVDGGGVTERIRGYRRKTDRLPYPNVSQDHPGKLDTSTPYVIGKVVSRLEADSRWALARSVRALVAERDALKQKIETRQYGALLPQAWTLGDGPKSRPVGGYKRPTNIAILSTSPLQINRPVTADARG